MKKEFKNENSKSIREEEERRGFRIHRTVYLCVITMLILINLTVSPEFLWFIFPLGGMGIGLTLHYYFGVKGGSWS